MKIGVQSQSGVIQDAGKVLAKHPAAWKLLGNALSLDFAKRIRAESPNTLIILRTQADNWSLDAGVVGYANRAMAIADPFLSAGVCDFLESPNEPIVFNDTDAKRLNEQQTLLANLYKQRGYHCLGYNFPVGNPPYELWRYLNDGLLACGGYVGLHEYGAPTLQSNAADLSLRHRKVHALLMGEAQSAFRVIVTEAGIDLGITRNPPDGLPTAGGYRALPAQGDDENQWIDRYTAQLQWWGEELEKDAYVIAATVYGYAMSEPWVGLGFDVANVDTDRERFIAWMGSGATNPIPPVPPPIPLPPIGVPMTPQQQRLTRAWNSIHVPYNPDAAFPQIAKRLGLGKPEGAEYINVEGMSGQAFNLAFLEGPAGDVLAAKAYDWLTGEEWKAPSVPPITPPAGIPPYAFPQVLTDNGACGEEGVPLSGKPFYRINSATVLQGVSAFATVSLIGKGAQIVNLFPDGHGEVFAVVDNGSVTFNFGASSAFSNPCTGPFTVFIAEGAVKNPDTKIVTWKNVLSDKVKSVGDWQAEHSEWRIQFAQVQ